MASLAGPPSSLQDSFSSTVPSLNLKAERFSHRPSLASMLELNTSDIRGEPDQMVIRFPGPTVPQQLRREEATPLAEIGLLVKCKDELVGDAKAAQNTNPQPALFIGLTDRSLFRRLARFLSTAGQEIAAGRRSDRDRGAWPLDDYVAAGAEHVVRARDGDTEFQDRGWQWDLVLSPAFQRDISLGDSWAKGSSLAVMIHR